MADFFDTHCHIHEISSDPHPDDLVQSKWDKAGIHDPEEVIREAKTKDVNHLMLVGCSLRDSKRAIELAQVRTECLASIGIHPHEAKEHLLQDTLDDFSTLAALPQVRAIGECGLDFFYEHSPKNDQVKILEFQLHLAKSHNLPVIFHVRQAFDDFWAVFDHFKGIRGVLHSYTDSAANLQKALDRGLYVGLNGIMTFTKDPDQHEVAKAVPLQKLLLETDAPFLTPAPYRGTICKPEHVVETARFLSNLRGEALEEIAAATTANAKELFKI